MKKVDSIDAYLAGVEEPARTTLQRLREQIRKLAPGATERISYGIPTFHAHGHGLVGFGAAKAHVSLYPMSGSVLNQFDASVNKYRTSKSTLQFPLEGPVPLTVVRKVVKARLAENAARAAEKAPRPKRRS